MDIRRATAADERLMRVLWEESNAEIGCDPYPSAAFSAALVTQHIALIAEEDHAIFGAVYANVMNDHVGFVFGLYVRPQARRQGLGRRLMLEAAEVLRAEGKTHIVLNVDTPNVGAQALYERLGFLDSARVMRIGVAALLAEQHGGRQHASD